MANHVPILYIGARFQSHKGVGFTMIELLIVIAILAVVAVFSIPFIQTFQISSDLNTTADQLTQAVRRVQLQARTGQNDADCGIAFNESGNQYTIFKGSLYASRDSTFDEVVQYQPRFRMTTDFGREIIFFKYSGTPTVGGTVTVADEQGNAHRTIRITDIGMVSHD